MSRMIRQLQNEKKNTSTHKKIICKLFKIIRNKSNKDKAFFFFLIRK